MQSKPVTGGHWHRLGVPQEAVKVQLQAREVQEWGGRLLSSSSSSWKTFSSFLVLLSSSSTDWLQKRAPSGMCKGSGPESTALES
jgi:hypothetical protein